MVGYRTLHSIGIPRERGGARGRAAAATFINENGALADDGVRFECSGCKNSGRRREIRSNRENVFRRARSARAARATHQTLTLRKTLLRFENV